MIAPAELARQSAEVRESRAVAAAIAETAKMRCRCGLRAGMSRAEIRALGGGCTMPGWACPRLDAVRRRLG